MAALVDIIPATEMDFPTLAHIAATAMAVDFIHRVMYESNNPLDTSPQEHTIQAELDRSAKNPQAHIFKAVLKSSGETVGYGMFRFDDGDSQAVGGPAMTSFPPGVNTDLLGRMSKAFRAAHSTHMGGKRHMCKSYCLTLRPLRLACTAFICYIHEANYVLGWTSLMVLPAWQRKGIGSAMFQYGFKELEADQLPIWLITQMRGRAMYQKFGFEDVGVLDIDFGEYIGSYRGFGVYRSVCMVRQPSEVLRSELERGIE